MTTYMSLTGQLYFIKEFIYVSIQNFKHYHSPQKSKK